MSGVKRRIRRTAEEARRIILDAAELRMAKVGPGGLRLQDIAADIGLSHPVILHHFGSREGLVHALNQRTTLQLKESLRAALTAGDFSRDEMVERVLRAVFNAFNGGLAQRLAFLGPAADEPTGSAAALIEDIVDLIHTKRMALSGEGFNLSRSDSRAIVFLVATSAMGNALFGGPLLGSPDQATHDVAIGQFQRWLRSLIGQHIFGMMINPGPAQDLMSPAA
ncbi:MAG: hypothetical protein B7Z78_03890 [Rhodospirillales bacterium 20-60-12]|nr:MAG: hypothetical protein B7Z78_03890 [Rhodospirillales bacterium 20-60-12]HQT67468.1 TetR/AcrR family transcriptional regulator [Acetobacteraceae bacterium]HQU01605.1 TetR/AcrR family transcriptional regulator [Acetobacteraceae bacterium]